MCHFTHWKNKVLVKCTAVRISLHVDLGGVQPTSINFVNSSSLVRKCSGLKVLINELKTAICSWEVQVHVFQRQSFQVDVQWGPDFNRKTSILTHKSLWTLLQSSYFCLRCQGEKRNQLRPWMDLACSPQNNVAIAFRESPAQWQICGDRIIGRTETSVRRLLPTEHLTLLWTDISVLPSLIPFITQLCHCCPTLVYRQKYIGI